MLNKWQRGKSDARPQVRFYIEGRRLDDVEADAVSPLHHHGKLRKFVKIWLSMMTRTETKSLESHVNRT